MRIMFVQFYAFILIAVITVTIGAPLEHTNTSMVPHLNKRETFPKCTAPYSEYRSSACFRWTQMLVTCGVPNNPMLTFSDLQPCKPNERCVPFSYYDPVKLRIVNHAKCVPDKKRTRDWYSDADHPRKRVCSERVSYIGQGQDAHLTTGVGTYTPLGNTINVDEIEVYKDGRLFDSNTNACNLSSHITNYNGNLIQYCFTANSVTDVFGIAAATKGDGEQVVILQINEVQQ